MSDSPHQISRRDVLKRGAIVGGSVLWVTPVVQTLGMTRALAVEPSDLEAGYELELQTNESLVGNPGNVPFVRLKNTSAAGVLLTYLKITIGDTAFNYDYIQNETQLIGVVSPTNIEPGYGPNNGSGPDFLKYMFANFDPGDRFEFEVDIDPDGTPPVGDFRSVLFNHFGADPNAQITVKFDNGKVLTQTMPDVGDNGLQVYSWSQSG